ncbi:MAG: hypothetical protein R3B90_10375 [Planctomycetaceae bacterium]
MPCRSRTARPRRELAERFEQLPTVGRVEHLGDTMPRYSPRETHLLVQAIHARLSRLSDLPREFPQIDPLAIGQSLESLLAALQADAADSAQLASGELDRFLNRFASMEVDTQVELLTRYQYAMLAALRGQFEQIAMISDPEPVSADDLAAGFRDRFVSPQGDWLVRVFPAEQVWEEAPLARFVADVRSVDPDVTGTPLQNFEAARQVRRSYANAAIYAFFVIVLVLLIDSLESGAMWISLLTPGLVIAGALITLDGPDHTPNLLTLGGLYVCMVAAIGAVFDFPSVRNTLLAMLPPVGGIVVMFGLLGCTGSSLNPANMIVLPLILGIGVDDGVHVLHDFRHQRGRYRVSPSTINAVLLTSLTSMVGFGSMMVATHRGLASLGLVLVVGVGSCLFVSLVGLPALLTLIAGRREEDDVGQTLVISGPPASSAGELASELSTAGESSDADGRGTGHREWSELVRPGGPAARVRVDRGPAIAPSVVTPRRVSGKSSSQRRSSS